MDLNASGYGKMTGHFAHGNKSSSPIKGGEFRSPGEGLLASQVGIYSMALVVTLYQQHKLFCDANNTTANKLFLFTLVKMKLFTG
jgi:hypothetical protein